MIAWDDVPELITKHVKSGEIAAEVGELAQAFSASAKSRLIAPSNVVPNPYGADLSFHWDESVPILELEVESTGFLLFAFQDRSTETRWCPASSEEQVPDTLWEPLRLV